MDKEMAQFQGDLLASVQQMKAGQAVCVTEATLSPVVAARHAVGLSQVQFARRIGAYFTTVGASAAIFFMCGKNAVTDSRKKP